MTGEKKGMPRPAGLLLSASLAVALPGAAHAFSTHAIELSRTAPSLAAPAGSSIEVTIRFVQRESEALRGWVYTENFPAGVEVEPVRVAVAGTGAAGWFLERGTEGDVLAGLVPWRWVLETPVVFAQGNPLASGAPVEVVFRVRSFLARPVPLAESSWSGRFPSTLGCAFGYGESTDRLNLAFCTDADMDGVYAEGGACGPSDCDDADALIHPGAVEACNGVDDDCDQAVDEGCRTFYRDADGDGYGAASQAVVATTAPSGYVADGTDCDDGNALVHPGAVESCNGSDDDCDQAVDEGCRTFYRDADGDGYGAGSQAVVASTAPPGYVADGTDCDDADAQIHPGAVESCNGVDDDCDQSVDEGCPPASRVDVDRIIRQFKGGVATEEEVKGIIRRYMEAR